MGPGCDTQSHKRGVCAYPVLQDGGEHAAVVPLALLLGVHHGLKQVLLGDLVQDGVEAVVQDLVSPLQRPRGAVGPILAVHQLDLVFLVQGYGALLDQGLQLPVYALAGIRTEPVPCRREATAVGITFVPTSNGDWRKGCNTGQSCRPVLSCILQFCLFPQRCLKVSEAGLTKQAQERDGQQGLENLLHVLTSA